MGGRGRQAEARPDTADPATEGAGAGEPVHAGALAAGFLPGEPVYLAAVTACQRADRNGWITAPASTPEAPVLLFGTQSGTVVVTAGP